MKFDIKLFLYKIAGLHFCLLFIAFLCKAEIGNPGLRITEIQCDPLGYETQSPGGLSHEFVEITNCSSVQIDLSSLFISDGTEADTIIPVLDTIPGHFDCLYNSLLLKPGCSALIIDRDYGAAVSEDLSCRIPIFSNTLLLTTGNSTIGNGLSLNEGLVIYRGSKKGADSVLCFAAEKEIETLPLGDYKLNYPANFKEGNSIILSSTFFRNDFILCPTQVSPGKHEGIWQNNLLDMKLSMVNTGKVALCTLVCSRIDTLIKSTIEWSLKTNPQKLTLSQDGQFRFVNGVAIEVIEIPLDSVEYFLEFTEENKKFTRQLEISSLWNPVGIIKINEIFPKGSSVEPEWFELTNVSSMTVSLHGWTYGNTDRIDTIKSDISIAPKEFLTITKDAVLLQKRYPSVTTYLQGVNWPTLDNADDTIYLWNQRGDLQDKAIYHASDIPEWKDGSIARILQPGDLLSVNWSSASKSTPSMPNTQSSEISHEKSPLTIGPVPFTPNHDGKNDALLISYNLPAKSSGSIIILGFDGREIRKYKNLQREDICWDGTDSKGNLISKGPFFVVFRYVTSDGSVKIKRARGILWR